MTPASSSSIATVLTTSISLIDQFISSLDVTGATAAHAESISHPSPLHLLSASANSLKSSTTKLSLLTITAPFTPSAIISVLQPLNTSVLPSLVTATLLTTPHLYPTAFVKECHSLTRSTLRDLKQLLLLTQTRSEDNKPKSSVSEPIKKTITEATGKVWEDVDLLVRFSNEGLPGFVTRKAKQWLELMKDAVKELEEWDPAEDDPDDQDWLGLDEEDDAAHSDEDSTSKPDEDTEKVTDRITISTGIKDQALKVLSRIPQSIHVVIKQRLEKLPSPPPTPSSSTPPENIVPTPPLLRKTLDTVLSGTRIISECIDESAEAMYMGDLELCLRKAGEARAWTIEVVENVLEPWEKNGEKEGTGGAAGDTVVETKEDQYIKRALLWIQQVQTGPEMSGKQGEGKKLKEKIKESAK